MKTDIFTAGAVVRMLREQIVAFIVEFTDALGVAQPSYRLSQTRAGRLPVQLFALQMVLYAGRVLRTNRTVRFGST